MKLVVDNVWTRVASSTDAEFDWLDSYTSCDYKVWRATPGWRPDKRYHMLSRASRTMPSGLVSLVAPAADRDGVELEVVDRRVKPAEPELDRELVSWLRDYQMSAVVAACKAGRGLIKAPTGAGKTEVFVGLTRLIPCEWLMVVHRADLVEQAANRFRLRTGERAGRWGSGRWSRGTSNVTVSTFQSVYSAMRKKAKTVRDFLSEIQAVNVDEVHAQPASTFYKVSLAMKNAYYRVGMSGTPLDRSDRDNLRTIGAIGPIVHDVSYDTLMELDVLSRAEVRMVEHNHPPVANGASWRQVYDALVVRSPERNELVADMAEVASKPCLLFVEEYAQGKAIRRLLELSGWRVDFASGSDWKTQRQRKVEDLVEGRTDVLLTTVIFQEGIDIPSLRSVVVANGKASTVASLQRIGRGMRRSEEKNAFEVWDVFDKGNAWLADHAAQRWRAYEGAGHNPERISSKKLLDRPRR